MTKGGEYEKLPKIGSTTTNKATTSNDCIVPFIENKGNPNEEKLRKFDSCIPDELILSLKQADQPKEGYIGPAPSKKIIAGIKPTVPVCDFFIF